MTSGVVRAVAVAVAGAIGFTGTHFSVRTLRYATAVVVIGLLATVTAYGQTPPGGRMAPSLQTAFAFGADRLAAEFFRPVWALWSAQQAPAPGRLGWTVIAVALLLGYRQAEKWALRRQAPQLDTTKLTGGQPSLVGDASPGWAPGADATATAEQRHDWLAAEVRFRLAAVDVYAPPILPGGTRTDGLASIAEASGVSGAGLAGAVIRFAGALWPAPRRYELRVWVESGAQRTAARPGGARSALAQAGTALARTAKAVTFQPGTARAVTVRAGTLDDVDDERLGSFTRVTSLEDLEREQLIALRLHALNREQYPRFLRGTYRLCMSLEMIANPEYSFLNPAAARVILDDTLDILYRAGRSPVDRCADGDIHPRPGEAGPSVLSHALREVLLDSARQDLRVIRRQLALPVVVWNTVWRRDERAVWLPHWRRATRQSFRDGVCVAELLVAVKHQLNAPSAGQGPGQRAGRFQRLAERVRQRKGLRIVAAIVGDAAAVRAALTGAARLEGSSPPSGQYIPPTRDRVRWLPGQARTASWQAAYNTACLYAFLVRQGLADEDRVVASLRRVVLNRDSGLERPHDWISNDPDFAPLLRNGAPYPKVWAFLEAQERRDYPMRQVHRLGQ